jgi:hypothetical protein
MPAACLCLFSTLYDIVYVYVFRRTSIPACQLWETEGAQQKATRRGGERAPIQVSARRTPAASNAGNANPRATANSHHPRLRVIPMPTACSLKGSEDYE